MAMSSPANGKPQIAEADVLALLHECFAAPIEDLEVVSGGQIAQTYGFSAGGERYILRFTQHMGANLDKELFIQRLLAASPVPVAPILHLGDWATCTTPPHGACLARRSLHCHLMRTKKPSQRCCRRLMTSMRWT